MSISTDKTAETFYDVVEAIPLNCDFPLYAAGEVQVVYGYDSLVATLNTDYLVELDVINYDTFTVTPKAALIAKIDALIAADLLSVEVNYVTVRRSLSNLTSAS